MKPIGLYIHIPFCKSKCGYCDFLSFAGKEQKIDAYLNALLKEAQGFEGYTAKTIFLGGGTPSILPKGRITWLLEEMRKIIPAEAGVECTIEANPNTIQEEKMIEYRDAGINRISIGLQSASNRLLKEIGRTHTYEDFCQAMEKAAKNFAHINVDLMYALPGQSMEDIEDTVSKVVQFPVDHVSAYALKIEEGTPFASKGVQPAPEELDREMYHRIVDLLKAAGFERYETSNFAKPGAECRHNIAYWTLAPYLGLGPGAHSFLNGKRWENTRDLERYLVAEGKPQRTDLGKGGDLLEWVMLSLRLSKGLDLAETEKRYGRLAAEEILRQAKHMERTGFLTMENGRVILTGKGFDIQNSVIIELLKNL